MDTEYTLGTVLTRLYIRRSALSRARDCLLRLIDRTDRPLAGGAHRDFRSPSTQICNVKVRGAVGCGLTWCCPEASLRAHLADKWSGLVAA